MREATPEEAAKIEEQEQRAFGYARIPLTPEEVADVLGVETESCPSCGQQRLVSRDDSAMTMDCDLCRAVV